ncbi:hypothetical protein KA071_00020 [Candidatus Gracilibacteria bacterium]|nr:hypothetical protein [Candidatus Gracilibacteria bacterium]
MKKILTFLIFCLPLLTGIANAYQKDGEPAGLLGANLSITTYTSEPCGVAGEQGSFGSIFGNTSQTARYRCSISASTGFIDFISSIYKYIFFISLVVGVLLMVVLGIGMSLSGVASEEMKSKAKSKIMDILIGLVALALIPWILKTIAPFFFT